MSTRDTSHPEGEDNPLITEAEELKSRLDKCWAEFRLNQKMNGVLLSQIRSDIDRLNQITGLLSLERAAAEAETGNATAFINECSMIRRKIEGTDHAYP